MSTCISQHGEFGSHILDDAYTCTLCHVLDEDALIAELRSLRAELAAARADAHRTAAERAAARAELGKIWDALGIAEDDDPGPDPVGDIRGLKITYREMKVAQKELAALRTAVAAIAGQLETEAGRGYFASTFSFYADRLRTALGGATSDQEAR